MGRKDGREEWLHLCRGMEELTKDFFGGSLNSATAAHATVWGEAQVQNCTSGMVICVKENLKAIRET